MPPKKATNAAKSTSTRRQVREPQPNDEPTPQPNTDLIHVDIIDSIRQELNAAINSDDFCTNLICKLVPAIAEAVKEKVCKEIHDTFQLELSKKQTQLDDAREEICQLRRDLTATQDSADRQEQYSRRNCLRIQGIPESPGESTDELVINLATEKLNVTLTPGEIDRSHRISPRPRANNIANATRPRAIIVKLTSYNTRDRIYRARTSLKGTRIYINEDLTRRNQELFARARKHERVNRSWTLDGKIFVIDGNDHKHHIANTEDLARLR
ncbi:putative cytochrome P450 2J5 [Apostichopus japonicus]|uniref:Putative cytochrome P450 2J5 n=1 Tax=Stichopus japonicus TaxID=307972 RepID=A0A2G8K371_STIJA|nr:putative cytochrome P450 2J5 [Apostichopus japonicus]